MALGNTNLLTTTKITKESLEQLNANLVVASKLDWSYSDEFAKPAAQIGEVLNVRRPILTEVREDSMTWGANLPVESYIALPVDKIFGVDLKFSDIDRTLRIEDFSKRFISQAMAVLAAKIDAYVFSKMVNNSYNTVGQYNTAVTSDTFLAAAELLNAYGAPDDGERYAVITPKQQRSLVNSQLNLFNPNAAIAKIYTKGVMGTFAGIEFAWSNTAPSRVDGTWAGTPTVATNGANLLTSGWADTTTVKMSGLSVGATLNVGDVFTISGCYGYNPLTKTVLPNLQQFVVRTAVTSAVASNQDVVVSPALITSGAYKNVDIQIAGASVSVIKYSTSGTAGQEGVMFHKTAGAIASPELFKPSMTVKAESIRDEETKASIRMIEGFDATNAYSISRIDTILGMELVRREFVTRIRG